ncbi:MAG: DUF4126 domain-containing protein [Jatrophihabitans sp.]|uniref:DUF4126 domain-containing protein n=1 Tax=Jatrophihabitans sp. TaxID=1932789 RepID=UPI003F80790F
MQPLLRAALAGLATGARSMTPVAAVAWTAGEPAVGGALDARLRGAKVLLGAGAVGELAADKLPIAPPRTQLPSFVFRLTLGAVSGAVVARRGAAPLVAGALVGAAASAVTTAAGPGYRAALAKRFGSDVPGALLEDAAALGLAAAAVR